MTKAPREVFEELLNALAECSRDEDFPVDDEWNVSMFAERRADWMARFDAAMAEHDFAHGLRVRSANETAKD